MVLNSYSEFMVSLYKNPRILEYLRFHPKWYKILYYDHNYDAFMEKAKKDLKIRLYDKLENVKKDVQLIQGLANYLGKK